jgi:hypothetical protein
MSKLAELGIETQQAQELSFREKHLLAVAFTEKLERDQAALDRTERPYALCGTLKAVLEIMIEEHVDAAGLAKIMKRVNG